MKNLRWALVIFLFFAPLIVTLAQISVLDFPTENPFFSGTPYSPYPQVIYLPLFLGVGLMILAIASNSALVSQWYEKLPVQVRLLIATLLIVINPILFWFSISLAQRAVIAEYLGAINANGLHFLGIFSSPMVPKVFPENDEFAFGVTIFIGTAGLLSMVVQYLMLLKHKD